jgi:outer membrane lipoprotein-sorting protein
MTASSVFSRRRLPLFPALFAIALAALAGAAAAQQPADAATVLRNVQREFDRVNDYRADIDAVAQVPNMKVPPMHAVVYFKKPDRVHIESPGFAMLPRDAVTLNPRMLGEELYDAVLQGSEAVDGVSCLKLKLLAKSDTLRLQRVMLYVDPARWIILRMTTDPAQGSTADARFTYAKVENRWWMPTRVQLQMTLGAGVRPRSMPKEKLKETERSGATVTLTYTNYRVNKGISDAVFAPRAK